LTEQDLIIEHPPRGDMAKQETNLTYVRLIPMDKPQSNTGNLSNPVLKQKR